MQDTIPIPKNGAKGQLGHWIDPDDLETELNMRFPGCMKGIKNFFLGGNGRATLSLIYKMIGLF